MADAKRRDLDFRDWDAVQADLDTLQSRGYDRAGNWSLAQISDHLADWLSYTMDGYPEPPLPMKLIMGVMRATVMPKMVRKTLETRKLPVGSPTFKQTVHPPGGDDSAGVDRFRSIIARFRAYDRPMQPSPMFGTVDKETAAQFQLIHAAHHLSFLVPKAG